MGGLVVDGEEVVEADVLTEPLTSSKIRRNSCTVFDGDC